MPESDRNFTDSLISLKTQYERSLTEASTKASHLREQLSHVNALLLNQLLSSNGVVPQLTQGAVEVPVIETITLASAPSLAASPAAGAPVSDRPEPKASDSSAQRLRKAKAPATAKPTTQAKAKAKPTTAPAKSRRSLEILPAYRGISKREAIAQILEQRSGEVLHQDTIIQALYGDLSLEDIKDERVRIDTSLRNGVKANKKANKWKKAPVPASYVLDAIASAPAAKATAAKPKSARKPAVAEAKPGRKPVVGKAKASQKVARSKKTELELVALLRKADIQV
jgi:hypothetical protein